MRLERAKTRDQARQIRWIVDALYSGAKSFRGRSKRRSKARLRD